MTKCCHLFKLFDIYWGIYCRFCSGAKILMVIENLLDENQIVDIFGEISVIVKVTDINIIQREGYPSIFLRNIISFEIFVEF
jgi:hypothetical protein